MIWNYGKVLNRFFKKPVEFTHESAMVRRYFPILPASKMRPAWLSDACTAAKKVKKEGDWATMSSTCSGLLDYFRGGYVVRCPIDIRVTTNGDGESINYDTHSPHDYLKSVDIQDVCAFFEKKYMADFVDMPPQTLKTIFKINTGWDVAYGTDYNFIYSPVTYWGETRFTAVPGILNPECSTALNIPLFWHLLEGITVIKAGTPLCVLIPVKKNKIPDLIIRNANDYELKVRQEIRHANAVRYSHNSGKIASGIADEIKNPTRRIKA